MAADVQLSTLVTRVRRTADMETGGPCSDEEIRDELLSSIQRLYDRLVDARGQEYYRTTAELNVTAGQAWYEVPADFYKLLALSGNRSAVMETPSSTFVRGNDSGGSEGWVLLRPFEMLELPRLLHSGSAGPDGTRYRLGGRQSAPLVVEGETVTGGPGAEQLELRPVPMQSWTLRLDYIPACVVELDGDLDLTVNGINGFEQIAVIEVAMYCLDKEESSTTHLQRRLALENERITRMALARDNGSPACVVDVCGLLDGGPDADPWAYVVPGWRR